MKALNEIKERAEACKKISERTSFPSTEAFGETGTVVFNSLQDIPCLCEALEYLLRFNFSRLLEQDVEQILSGMTEKSKDADGKED